MYIGTYRYNDTGIGPYMQCCGSGSGIKVPDPDPAKSERAYK